MWSADSPRSGMHECMVRRPVSLTSQGCTGSGVEAEIGARRLNMLVQPEISDFAEFRLKVRQPLRGDPQLRDASLPFRGLRVLPPVTHTEPQSTSVDVPLPGL